MMYTTILGQKEKVALKDGIVQGLVDGLEMLQELNEKELELLQEIKNSYQERTGTNLILPSDILTNYNLELSGRTKKGIALLNEDSDTVILVDAIIKKEFDLEDELELFQEKLEEQLEKEKEKKEKEEKRLKEREERERKKAEKEKNKK